MHLMSLFLAVSLMVPQWAWANPQCEQDYAIWVSEADGVRHIVYGSEGVRYYSNVYFEEWRQSRLAWRSKDAPDIQPSLPCDWHRVTLLTSTTN